MKTQDIAFAELHLNIEHQNIKPKDWTYLGYQFDEHTFAFVLIIPKKMLPKRRGK